MNFEVVFLYLGAWTVVALTPGPAVMCAVSLATRFGFRQAFAGIVGIQLGHFAFFGGVACGLAAILATATTAFSVLRTIGAAYLIYVGARAIASTFGSHASELIVAAPPARSSLVIQGFAIQVSNPKALLFMSALLPQFIQAQQPLSLQLSILLAITIAVDIVVLGTYAYLAAHGTRSLRASGIVAWLQRVFGAAFILLGVRLLVTRR